MDHMEKKDPIKQLEQPERDGRIPVLVSACLLGRCCRYDGGSRPVPGVLALVDHPGVRLLPICPEVDGGLPTPRPPAERVGARVMNTAEADVTEAYVRGAAHACRLAQQEGATLALCKARSPSCGNREIYDGSFSGRCVPGRGVCCEMLSAQGVTVYNEEELGLLLQHLPYA